MLSRAQQILLKRAQAEAGLDDNDYRDCISIVSGHKDCRSSKDPRLTDGHLDNLMSYFEAIYWKRFPGGRVPPPGGLKRPVFTTPNYWAFRNRRGNTTRDRYTNTELRDKISAAEAKLGELGFHPSYAAAIRRNVGQSSDRHYLIALERTIRSKVGQASRLSPQQDPF